MALPLFRETDAESTFPFLEFTLAFALMVYVLETYLDVRQYKRLLDSGVPASLAEAVQRADERRGRALQPMTRDTGVVEAKDAPGGAEKPKPGPEHDTRPLFDQLGDKFAKSQDYGAAKKRFGFFRAGFVQVESMSVLALGAMPWMWQASVRILDSAAPMWNTEIARSLVFVTILTLYSTIVNLPFAWYSTFVIEQRFGFNRQTLGLFCKDKLKSLALAAVIGSPVLAIIVTIVRWAGPHFYLYTWLFMTAFSFFMVTIYPTLIAPCFNKFSPLEDGELKQQIEALARRLKFPLTRLFVVDGSKRSNHSNAYMFGFCNNKRIVLFDTLIEQSTTEEILAVLAHELGHWRYWHTLQMFVTQSAYTFAALWTFSHVLHSSDLYVSFGFSAGEMPVVVGLMLFFQAIWSPVDHVLSFLLNLWSRRNEYQADEHAVGLGYASQLQSGLVKLHLENLGTMSPDPWYSAYHFSHPPLTERLNAIEAAVKRKRAD